ncbi:MAG: DUF6340 family protein, partial [Bacteroidales bacterium]
MKNVLCIIFILSVVLFTSCGTTSVTVDVMEPAAINLPQKYQKLLLTNRSLPDDDNKVENVVEGLFSKEALFADRLGSKNCVAAMDQTLNENDRFKSRICENCEFHGTGTAKWPLPLSWDSVKNACDRNNADALVCIETFDTDKHINHSVKTRKRTKDGETTYSKKHKAILRLEITSGIRIYDPYKQQVLHEHEFYDELSWEKRGDSRSNAEGRLPSHRKSAREAGTYTGQNFASYISPTWKKTSRNVYTSGNDEMKSTKQLVKNGEWKKAASIWKKYTDSNDNKLAARANYNMAVAAEIQGNIDAAIEWAKQSLELDDSHKTKS